MSSKSSLLYCAILLVLSIISTSGQPPTINWVKNNGLPSANSEQWKSVAYGNGIFIAVAQGTPQGTGAVSVDGITWKQVPIPLPNGTSGWISISFANGVFVVLGAGTGTAVCTNGLDWKAGSLPIGQHWVDVAGGNGVFVAVSGELTTVSAVSSNGLNWTQITLPSTNNWNSIAYGNGVFVMVGSGTTTVSSTDGVQWQVTQLKAAFASIAFGNGSFVALQSTYTSKDCYISTNGVQWNKSFLEISGAWDSITYGDGVFLTIGSTYSSQGELYGQVSPNGYNWTMTVLPLGQSWSDITFGNGSFVAIGPPNGEAAVGNSASLYNSIL